MFSRARSEANKQALVPSNGLRQNGDAQPAGASIIAADLHVQGNILTEGELQVDGTVEGDITGRMLTIGESGEVVGQIASDEVIIQGSVNGSVRARKVHLTSTCRVIADISHELICIDEGASFDGQCRRVDAVADDASENGANGAFAQDQPGDGYSEH